MQPPPGDATSLTSRQRLVGNVAHEVLEKAVLPMLGRAGVRLDGQDLLADKTAEHLLERSVVDTRDGGEPAPRERLPENRPILQHAPLVR